MEDSKTLLCVTARGGAASSDRIIDSVVSVDSAMTQVDRLVLDDSLPALGQSDKLADTCRQRGVAYYRAPRNLGVVRNVNLGLIAAKKFGYDFLVVTDSDVICPGNLVDRLVSAYQENGDSAASVTALSSDASIYSVPNKDPDKYLTNQDTVNWLSATLAGVFGGRAVDVPAGLSFCMLVPVAAIQRVGLMDPIFTLGYCHDVDWSCRSRALGLRTYVAPGVFVYHARGDAAAAAGIFGQRGATVFSDERVIDTRYPAFRTDVADFEKSGEMARTTREAIRSIISAAGRELGYAVEVAELPHRDDDMQPLCTVTPSNNNVVLRYKGFRWALDEHARGATRLRLDVRLAQIFERAASVIEIRDHCAIGDSLAGNEAVVDTYAYPTRPV